MKQDTQPLVPEHWTAVLQTPPPALPQTLVADILAEKYGLCGSLKRLDSERDQNFLLELADGAKCLFKVSNRAEDPEVTHFQTHAFLHVEKQDPTFPVSKVLKSLDGAAENRILFEGVWHIVRLFSWIEGIPLSAVPSEQRPDNPELLGDLLARLALALKDYQHPASDYVLLYDARHAASLAPFLAYIEDQSLHRRVQKSMDRFQQTVLPLLNQLPLQVVFNDLSPRNYIVNPANLAQVNGLIDFGDMVRTPRIVDIATACVYWLDASSNPLGRVARFVASYHKRSPLQQREIELLLDLMRTRAMILPLIYHWRANMFPENREYIMHNLPQARRVLETLAGMDVEQASTQFLRACTPANGTSL
ncbi:MAG: phosphotransferase [Rhodoferax sp.]|nr:phosphotransferase [Rhodoferax sp.]